MTEQNETNEVENTEQTNEETQENTTFTQSEVDSQISKAVESFKKKNEKTLEERIANERKEAERLAKLSEKERDKEKLTAREIAADEREAALIKKELLADAESDLRGKDLPTSFASVLLGEDAEKTLENINNFKTTFDQAVNNAVKEKLRQDTPPAGDGNFRANKGYDVAEIARNARIIK